MSLSLSLYSSIDYRECYIDCTVNYRFSGLTAKDLVNVTTTLSQVQDDLLHLFSSDTILVGHSLESDFKALKVTLYSL